MLTAEEEIAKKLLLGRPFSASELSALASWAWSKETLIRRLAMKAVPECGPAAIDAVFTLLTRKGSGPSNDFETWLGQLKDPRAVPYPDGKSVAGIDG